MPRHIIHQPRYLGENLKRLRRQRDWTVERLADAIGVSKGYVSMVESGKRSPHWVLLMKIAHALDDTLCRFFTTAEKIPPPEDGIRSQRENRIVVDGDPLDERGGLPRDSTKGYTHILTPWHRELVTEVIEIYLPPHSEWTPEPIGFRGGVTGWNIEGKLLLVRGGTEYIMHQGECLSYDASAPHMLRNYTDDPTRTVLTVSPASF
jgi:transcriptional regulator with XRE-family HTH domain